MNESGNLQGIVATAQKKKFAGNLMDDWKKRLSALRSNVVRFKVEQREECAKDLEANVETFSRRVASCTHIPTGELGDDWAVLCKLTEVLGDCKVSRDIVRKALALFNLLIDVDREFAVFLYHCCNVLSVVKQQLADTSVLDGAVSESLCLVQRISTNVSLPVMDPTVDLIVQYLLAKIKMTGDPELLLPCLECLASLSSGNIGVQSAIKSQSSLKEINNKLIHLLTGSSSRVTLVTLHVLASLSLNSSLGEALFSTNNIEQTFGIIFNIFYHHGDDKTSLFHAVDLMVMLLACERIRTAFVRYKHLRACVQSTLMLLIRSSGESAGKLCELFQAFLSVPELHQMIVNTFFGPLSNLDRRRNEGGGQGGSSLVVTCLLPMMRGSQEGGERWSGARHRSTNKALDLLREVMEGAVACGLLHSVLLFLPALLPVLQQQLTGGMSSRRDGSTEHIRHSELETLDLTLAVLITVSEIDTAPDEAVHSITPSVIERIWSLVQSASARPWWAASLPKGQSEGLILGKRCFEDVKVGVTTKLLHFCILMCGVSNAFNSLLNDLLLEGDVMAMVARGLLSDDGSTVGRVLRVIQHTGRVPTFVSHGLRDSVMAACAHHTQTVQEREKLRAQQVGERPTASHSLTTSGVNHHDNGAAGGPSEGVKLSSSAKGPLESVWEGGVATPPPSSEKKSVNPPLEVDIEAIEELIRKMKEGVGKLQDARASEIMMVYECKLQNMTTKETHLQELLEAKANALFHADRLNSQYRGKMAQIEAECMKLRKLLQQAEKRSEKSQEQATQLQDMIDQSQKEKAVLNKKVAHFTDETNKLRTVVAEYETVKKDLASTKTRLEDTQKAKVRLDHKLLSAVKKTEELEQIGVQHQAEQARLQRLLHRGEEEKAELTRHIAAQEKQFKELKGGIAVFEQQVAEMEAMHREELQRREELSSQLTLAHREKAHILEQKNLLEEDCQRLEICNEEQKKEIDQLHRENETLQNKFRHIQSVLGDGIVKTR